MEKRATKAQGEFKKPSHANPSEFSKKLTFGQREIIQGCFFFQTHQQTVRVRIVHLITESDLLTMDDDLMRCDFAYRQTLGQT